MNRTILLIRHAKAMGGRHDRHLFPKEGAELSEEGEKASLLLKDTLRLLGIDVATEPVAVSELIRTKQTAQIAGFKNINEYKVLNEVDTGLSPEEIDEVLVMKGVPSIASNAAKQLLKYPPKEKIWVTHGMLIAALANELGIPTSTLYIPEMASVTEIEIPINNSHFFQYR